MSAAASLGLAAAWSGAVSGLLLSWSLPLVQLGARRDRVLLQRPQRGASKVRNRRRRTPSADELRLCLARLRSEMRPLRAHDQNHARGKSNISRPPIICGSWRAFTVGFFAVSHRHRRYCNRRDADQPHRPLNNPPWPPAWRRSCPGSARETDHREDRETDDKAQKAKRLQGTPIHGLSNHNSH